MKRIILFLLAVIGCSQVYAQAGLPDPGFGQNGFVFTDFGAGVNINGDVCRRILLKSDGSFFLVFEMNEQSMVTHRWANGSLDKNYGNNGYSKAVFMREPCAVQQDDGKIVIGGFTMVNNTLDFVLARLNTDGSLDAGFSGDGMVSFDFASTADYIRDLALQPDGKILAVGQSNSGTQNYFALARLNQDGSFDHSFSDDGKLLADITVGYESANSVALQADGKIVIAGDAQGQILVSRFLANGSMDTGFSADGLVFVSTGIFSSARGVVLQADGRITVAGSVAEAGSSNFLLIRLLADGALDGSFSADGKLSTDFGADETAEVLALQPDGKILAAGSTRSGINADFVVARYNADGSADNAFSGDGKQITSVGNSVDFAYDLALQTDGRILVAGWSQILKGYSYAAVRYLADGSLDLSFADGGRMVDYKPAGYAFYYAIAVQSNGKIITAGYANRGGDLQFAAARYNRSGSLDSGFGQDGKQVIDFGPGRSLAYDIALQPDGKILLAGYTGNGNDCYFALARLNPDGSLDNSFDGDGKLVLDRFANKTVTEPYAKIVIQTDGRIVIAGHGGSASSGSDILLVRCLPDGTIDAGFGIGGQVETDLGSGSDMAFDLLLQPDEKLVAVGAYDFNGDSKIAVVRYSKDGLSDPTFGNGGIVITDISEGRDVAFAAALQPDGKIVAAGSATAGAGNDFLLVRYNSNGVLDNSFSQDGKLVFNMGSTSEVAMAVVVQNNGKVITAGYSHDGSSNVAALAAFNPDGTFDSDFSMDGKIIGEPGRALLFDLAIDGNRLYAAGSGMQEGANTGFVAAYLLAPACPQSFVVSVPDAMSIDRGAEVNTVYRGYAPASQINLSSVPAGGHAPYSYLWSNGAVSSGISVSPSTTTTYSLTVTDANGCRASTSKQVVAVDVHCGNNNDKVSLCQVSGADGKPNAICVAGFAVAAHLKNGSRLGLCVEAGAVDPSIRAREGAADLIACPNPSSGSFRLQFNSLEAGKCMLIVRDAMGRIVEEKKINGQRVAEIGINYRAGVYFISLVQGSRNRSVRVVKE